MLTRPCTPYRTTPGLRGTPAEFQSAPVTPRLRVIGPDQKVDF